MMKGALILVVVAASVWASRASVPVVIWHGMGDSCCNPMSMGSIKKLIEDNVPGGVYVRSLMIGDSVAADTENGFFMNVNKQVAMACAKIASDPKLAGGYHAVGFSQGGQFLRAVAQRCPNPPMKNLVTVGGQHQGVYGFPKCPEYAAHWLCAAMDRLLNIGAYVSWVQNKLVQAEYWHDPTDEDKYRQASVFLADINNAKSVKNATYKSNLQKLENFVMVKFLRDTMVFPRESEWFGWFKPGSTKDTVPLTQTTLYKEDWLGLKAMDKAGKLHYLSVDADHLRINEKDFVEQIIKPYLQ